VRSFHRGGIHRHREHGTRALRSLAVSIGERAGCEFLNVAEVGRLVKSSLKLTIQPVAPAIDFAEALGRVKGPLRRFAPLTRPARSL
jgi:hypothetical protein